MVIAHVVFSGQAFFHMPKTIGKGIHQRKWLYPSPQQSNPCTFCRISVCPWCFSWREALFVQSNDDGTCFFAGTMVDRGRTMIPSTTLLLKLPVYYSNSISMTDWSPALSSSTLTPVLTRESLTWWSWSFCGRPEMLWKCFWGVQFICMAKRDFAILLNSSDHSS
jgi:hypothetical protein